MGTAATKHDDAARAIEALDREFERNLALGDPEKLVDAFYAPDALFMPPEKAPIKGRAGILEFWRETLGKAGIKTFKVETTQVEAEGDLACGIGRYSMSLQPPGGEATSGEGKYVVVYRRRKGGEWRAIADIFNNNQ
jgi:uncharacterized protein (TIGR02246 family)